MPLRPSGQWVVRVVRWWGYSNLQLRCFHYSCATFRTSKNPGFLGFGSLIRDSLLLSTFCTSQLLRRSNFWFIRTFLNKWLLSISLAVGSCLTTSTEWISSTCTPVLIVPRIHEQNVQFGIYKPTLIANQDLISPESLSPSADAFTYMVHILGTL